jgi:membrane protein implicated in regulation of membrane protease activity
MLGLLCALSLIGSVVMGFMSGSHTGAVLLLGIMLMVPAFIVVAIQYWPASPLGKMVLVPPPSHPDEVLPETHQYRGLRELVGKRGVAKSVMLPGGIVQVEGKSYDAISEGTVIESGQRVVVVQISTQRLVVRADDGSYPETSPVQAELAHISPVEGPPPADIQDPFAEEEARS